MRVDYHNYGPATEREKKIQRLLAVPKVGKVVTNITYFMKGIIHWKKQREDGPKMHHSYLVPFQLPHFKLSQLMDHAQDQQMNLTGYGTQNTL